MKVPSKLLYFIASSFLTLETSFIGMSNCWDGSCAWPMQTGYRLTKGTFLIDLSTKRESWLPNFTC